MVVVDVQRERVVRIVDLPDGPGGMPQDVKLASDGRIFYVADMRAGGVWEIGARSFRVVRFLATGAGAHGLYQSRDGRFLYVTNRSEGSVSVISFRSRHVVAKWWLPGGGSPDMGGVSADGRVLWLSGRYNADVYAISTRTGHLLARIRVGAGPHARQRSEIEPDELLTGVSAVLLDGTSPSTDEARVLTGLAGNLMLAGRCAESIPFAERAIESARAVGAQVIESRALNILGVDHANLGRIATGIDLLRQSVAIALIVDDPIEVPRSYANLGSMLEFGGFVEEALETSMAGAESTGRYGGELSFRWLLETNAALMLIELARYPEAAFLLEQNVQHVLPGAETAVEQAGAAQLFQRRRII
jgi:hypothetical protein